MQINSRASWNARPPDHIDRTTWARRSEFDVHYSGASELQTYRSIQDYHMDTRGWADIGYNMLVDNRTGVISMGRGWLVIGAHATGHNTSGIGVLVKGKDDPHRVDVTPAALAAVRWLYDEATRLKRMATGAHFTPLAIRGHRDIGNTDCPGDELYKWVHAGMPTAGLPIPTPPAPPARNWTEVAVNKLPTLQRNSRGNDVRRLQALINAERTPRREGAIGEDGDFGPATEGALTGFQRRHGLKVDGVAGEASWVKLLSW